MKKTLGGDRLGAGQKMTVDLHGYERSTHDMGYIWRSTMSAGTLVPFLCEIALPGDTFDINLNAHILTHPTVGPLFGSYKVQLDLFQCPIRLYQGQLHNNKLGIGMKMADVKLPTITLTANPVETDPNVTDNIDNSQINPSCLLSYLGIRGVAWATEADITRDFNAIPLLAYWDIYKNYYSNKQEERGAVIHRPKDTLTTNVSLVQGTNDGGITPFITINQAGGTGVNFSVGSATYLKITVTSAPIKPEQLLFITSHGVIPLLNIFPIVEQDTVNPLLYYIKGYTYDKFGTGLRIHYWDYINPDDVPQISEPKVEFFPLENIDNMREAILQHAPNSTPFNLNTSNITPYEWLITPDGNYHSKKSSQEGLGIKTYQSDLFNNWIKTEWIDGPNGISEITKIDTSDGSFKIDTLILSRKVYDLLNRIAVSGGTYDDWLDAVYTHDRYTRCESPMYMGGLIKELIFQEVISNSEALGPDGSQPLGTLAGRGVLGNKHKGGTTTIKVDEPSYIMGIISLTPRLDYSQGNKWDVNLKTMDDLHKPGLDEIGFQELITEQLTWWSTSKTTSSGTVQSSAGKQPAWINYMTNVNQVRGNFAVKDNQMFMVLNRNYEYGGTAQIFDLTTYIDPVKFNHIFAQTSLDAQNFWAQIGIDMTVRRKISARLMPNL